MPLQGFGRRSTTGFIAWIQWSHRLGMWSDREEADIAFKEVVFDFRFIRTGHGYFERGEPPQWVWDKSLGEPVERPGKGWRRAIGVRLLLPGARLRELKTTSAGLCDIIAKLYAEFELTLEFSIGECAVVDQVGVETAGEISGVPIYDPTLKIVGFCTCPPEFEQPPVAEATETAATTKPSSQALALKTDDLDDEIPL
jgi:hypothetical protein